jgi:hypothetical protein
MHFYIVAILWIPLSFQLDWPRRFCPQSPKFIPPILAVYLQATMNHLPARVEMERNELGTMKATKYLERPDRLSVRRLKKGKYSYSPLMVGYSTIWSYPYD